MSLSMLVAGAPLRAGSPQRATVVALQAVLAQAGYRIAQDGDFGQATLAAVRDFQAKHALGADGVIGMLTAKALDAVAAAGGAAPKTIAVAARSDFSSAPIWFQWALHEIGVHEVGNNAGPDVRRYIEDAHVGQEGWPWCAEFVNAALEVNGIRGTRSASSQSFLAHPEFVQLDGPALGAIAVFGRGHKSSGLGHVCFYRGEAGDRVYGLGGNEGDAVRIEAFARSSATFWLEAYCWPKAVPLPAIAPVPIRAGEPLISVKVV